MYNKTFNPEHIIETAFGFQASKTLLTAVNLGVFDALSDNPKTLEEIEDELDLHPRSSEDFLDTLVALDILDRKNGKYSNTPEAEILLVSGKKSYVGGLLEMANDRLYNFWDDLEKALKTGKPTNELEDHQKHPFKEAIYQNDKRLEQFVGAMTGLSMGTANILAENLPWENYQTVIDLGTSEGIVPKRIAEENNHIKAIGVDLPKVKPYFQKFINDSSASDRIKFETGDFLEDETLPSGDVYILGHILHDWGLDQKKNILSKVYDAINQGGRIIIYGTLQDNERKENEMSLLMSLNMLIETPNGFDYTYNECISWLKEAGFKNPKIENLPGPESMITANKT